jgi:hypothetical protein
MPRPRLPHTSRRSRPSWLMSPARSPWCSAAPEPLRPTARTATGASGLKRRSTVASRCCPRTATSSVPRRTVPVGELALCRPIMGEPPRPGFPAALAATATECWCGGAAVGLMFGAGVRGCGGRGLLRGDARRGHLCIAHARLAERREWVVNEKALVQRADLDAVQTLLATPGATSAELAETSQRSSPQPAPSRSPPADQRATCRVGNPGAGLL